MSTPLCRTKQESVRCLLFNIGNTRTATASLLEDGSILPGESFPTESFDPALFCGSVPLAAASVVPRITELFRNAGAFLVHPEMENLPVSLSHMKTPETIGADRIANACAMAARGILPAVSIDCGTAVNMEFVDSSRALLGGAILPGRRLQRQVLHEYTGNKLPVPPLDCETLPDFPGNNTPDALRAGIDLGIAGAIRELVSRMKRKNTPDAHCYFCGGDAAFFRKLLPDLCAETVENLTLEGIAFLWKWNDSQNRRG